MTDIDTVEAARRAMVKEIVDAMGLAGEALSHEAVAARLPEDFNYDPQADDYEQHVGGEMDAVESIDSAAAEKPSSPEVLRQRVRDLDQECADARANITILGAQLARARSSLATALQVWFTGERAVSSEDNIRAHLRGALEERTRLAEFGPTAVEQPYPGNSVIDRQAAYSHGGNANDHVRAQMRTGYRRGSMPASARGGWLPSNRT